MPYLLNLLYLVAGLLLAPWLGARALATGRRGVGLLDKFFGRCEHPLLDVSHVGQVVWFHGVSVGEVHLLRNVVAQFRRRHPEWRCVVSATTPTGHAEARRHFPDLPVLWWPLDFTWAVARALRRVRPDLIVLAEGELWPNFLRAARRRGARVALINARMSPRSAARYLRLRALARHLVTPVDWIGAQTEEYADYFRALGAADVTVTGSVKYDGVQTERGNARTEALRHLLRLDADAPIWVVGSTQEPEERVCVEIYRRVRALHPRLRLIVVPRHPERFDAVARLLEASGLPIVRRSACSEGAAVPTGAVILGDTMGELGALWGLADLAYVGGSLDGKRGGQNMIEPAAYGAAVLFGPHTWNFRETVRQLLARSAAIEVADAATLDEVVRRLLADAALRARLGAAASQFVRSQQGATATTLDRLECLFPATSVGRRAA